MIDVAAWTLLHFLWEGTVVALLVLLPLRFLRQASARYVLACSAMLLMFALPVTTFLVLTLKRNAGPATAEAFGAGFVSFPIAPTLRLAAAAARSQVNWAPLVVAAWAIGVAFLSLKNAGGLLLAYLWGRKAVVAVPAECYVALRRIAVRLGINRSVELRVSLGAVTPFVLGWIRPVIIIPSGALKLPLQQLEALLAHELAHIRRHDFLFNLTQKCVETMLFYHPAVWWLSRRIRDERENCCDDLAVSVCRDRVTYARALANLEELRSPAPQLAMAANGSSLVRRIARLLGQTYPAQTSSFWFVLAAAMVGIAALAGAVTRAEQQRANPPVMAEQQQPQQAQGNPAAESQSYIGQLAAAGYKDLSVDDVISFKIHDVTSEYIRGLQALGFKPAPADLISSRIHGVSAQYAKALQDRGFALSLEQLISGRIHGVDPDVIDQLKAAGFSSLTFDQEVTARIHGITPEFVRDLKDTGLGTLSFDDIVTARIHGIDAAFVRKAQQSGLKDLTFNNIVQLKIHRILD